MVFSMKLAFPIALALTASVGNAVADQAPVAGSSNATSHGESNTVQGCVNQIPTDGLRNWYYNSKAEGPYTCTANHDTKPWGMLRSYRSGGTQGVHWKYTDNQNDPECMNNWAYYSSDGLKVLDFVLDRTTLSGDTRRWCALPVYRSGGIERLQWAYCTTYCDS